MMGPLMLLMLPVGIAVVSCAANHLQNRPDDPSGELALSLVLALGVALLAPLLGMILVAGLALGMIC